MDQLAQGVALLMQAESLLVLIVGLIAGFFIGVMPGLSGATGAAILLPFTLAMPISNSLLMLGGVYAGASFSGGVPAILLNVPGVGSAAATAIDGYPMAVQGRGGLAIGIARTASMMGGVIGGVVGIAIIGPLADISIRFGPLELFIIALIGLSIIALVISDDPVKGLLSGLLGLLVAAMAADPTRGIPRMTFGLSGLYDSVPFVPAIIGLFAVTQMTLVANKQSLVMADTESSSYDGDGRQSWAEKPGEGGALTAKLTWIHARWFRWRMDPNGAISGFMTTLRFPRLLLVSSLVGTFIGALPGAGTSVATFASWGVAKKQSKDPDAFGKGSPEGVAAAECAENATASATLIPTLTLGIPGSATAAIMLAALYLHGIQPGPRVMESNADAVYAVLLGLILASVLILPLGILLAAPMVRITRVPPPLLVPLVLAACAIGAFSVRGNLFDMGLIVAFGILGVCLRLSGFPVVPMVLGMILGPIAESSFLRSLLLGNESISYFFSTPLSRILWGLLALPYLVSGGRGVAKRFRRRNAERNRELVDSQ